LNGESESTLPPLQSPLAVQEIVFVVDQLKLTEPPTVSKFDELVKESMLGLNADTSPGFEGVVAPPPPPQEMIINNRRKLNKLDFIIFLIFKKLNNTHILN